MIGRLVGWVVGWLAGWIRLAGWLAGWLVGWLFGCLVGGLFDPLVGWLAGWLVGWLLGWLLDCLVSGLAGWLHSKDANPRITNPIVSQVWYPFGDPHGRLPHTPPAWQSFLTMPNFALLNMPGNMYFNMLSLVGCSCVRF